MSGDADSPLAGRTDASASATPVERLVPDWPAPSRVIAFVTTRRGGVSRAPYGLHDGRPGGLNLADHVGDDPHAVATNRARLDASLAPVWLRQVHGVDVADLDIVVAREGDTTPTADAAVASHPGVACAILVADCMPVVFADTQGRVVGAAHAGWRGLAAGVIEKTLVALRAKAPNARWLAWIGPCIGRERFEIGPEVRSALLDADPGADAAGAFTRGRGDRFHADLAGLATRRLHAAGVAWVGGFGACNAEDAERFYSFRRDGTTGRFAAVVSTS